LKAANSSGSKQIQLDTLNKQSKIERVKEEMEGGQKKRGRSELLVRTTEQVTGMQLFDM
jgi:hypothetical protein